MDRLPQSIIEKYGIEQNADLKPYTNIRIGGTAEYLVKITSIDSFVELFKYCKQAGIRFQPLGQGSNVFFSDKGFDGLVAVLAFDGIEKINDTSLCVQAGTPLSAVNRYCICNSLTGFEFSSGIPGTVGGAVYGNAGAYGRNIGECIKSATVLIPNGTIEKVDVSFFNFSYRHSALKENNAILLDVCLELQKGEYDAILKRVREIHAIRSKKLPHWSTATAGSFFKNIPNPDGMNIAAAKYLDSVGSKETTVGDAGIHPKHANIFYNRGNATAKDILQLEEILRERVREKYNLVLEREVMFIE